MGDKSIDPSATSAVVEPETLNECLASEARNWEEELTQVETKLSGFEKDIVAGEDELAELLNKCDALLHQLEAEVPGNGAPDDYESDEDAEIEAELRSLGRRLTETGVQGDAVVSAALTSQPWFSMQLTDEWGFLNSKLVEYGMDQDFDIKSTYNSDFLCEYCGTLISGDGKELQDHLNGCGQAADRCAEAVQSEM